MDMNNELTEVRPPKPIKYNRKQIRFMELWTNPTSHTFGNVFKSGMEAGFSPTYSRNLANVAPSWLLSYIDKIDLHPEHIKQGVQKIAVGDINSKSVDDTRLKAYEMLARFNGMLDNKNTVNIVNVQPILSGQSTKPHTNDTHVVIDQEPAQTPPITD